MDVLRQVSTIQAAQHDTQHIDEVAHLPALMQSEVPTIPDADDPWTRLQRKTGLSMKSRLPMPTGAVFESRPTERKDDADESDSDRFDDLVLPSLEGKTLFVNSASGDEAEDGAEKEQEMTRSLVQGGASMLVDETDAQGPGRELV